MKREGQSYMLVLLQLRPVSPTATFTRVLCLLDVLLCGGGVINKGVVITYMVILCNTFPGSNKSSGY